MNAQKTGWGATASLIYASNGDFVADATNIRLTWCPFSSQTRLRLCDHLIIVQIQKPINTPTKSLSFNPMMSSSN